MKFIKNKTVGKLFYALLTFILSFCIVIASLCALFRFTVFSRGFLSDTLNNSNYYKDLCDEITDDLMDIGDAGGLDKKFFEGFVDEVLVREDVQNYIDAFYTGKELKVNPAKFESALRSAINSYIKENNISQDGLSQKAITYFVNEAAKIYSSNIKISYFNVLQKAQAEYSFKLTLYAAISIFVAAGITVLFFFANKWKHIALRYLTYATISAALFTAIIPVAVLTSGVLRRITIISRSLNDMYMACLNTVFVDMLIIAGVLFVISIVLILVHNKLRRKAKL